MLKTDPVRKLKERNTSNFEEGAARTGCPVHLTKKVAQIMYLTTELPLPDQRDIRRANDNLQQRCTEAQAP